MKFLLAPELSYPWLLYWWKQCFNEIMLSGLGGRAVIGEGLLLLYMEKMCFWRLEETVWKGIPLGFVKRCIPFFEIGNRIFMLNSHVFEIQREIQFQGLTYSGKDFSPITNPTLSIPSQFDYWAYTLRWKCERKLLPKLPICAWWQIVELYRKLKALYVPLL